MQKPYLKFFTILALLFSFTMHGQEDYSKTIQNYLEKNKTDLKVSSDDVAELKIYDHYYTKSMDLTHVYAIQTINNIPVFNGIGNFAIKEGKVVYFSNSFKANLKSKVNTSRPSLGAAEAISSAAAQLGLGKVGQLEARSAKGAHEFVFSKAGISLNEIPVKLIYQTMEDGSLQLAWDLSIHTLDGAHWWNVRVDATSGQIIDKGDWIVKCAFPTNSSHNTHAHASQNTATAPTFGKAAASFVSDGSQYEVFELPIESPNHGNRTIVSEPADATASPHGWHDTNGLAGAEYTTTRGNNVWAFENRDGDTSIQPGSDVDGGTSLDFTFPLDLNQDPINYLDAAITNLFYMNNMLHDIWYQYGFDEVSGNFQGYNFGNGGFGGDYVQALAQANADNGPGNNAVFGTPEDGQNPVMQMFTWSAAGNPKVLTINSPANLAGDYEGTVATFGPAIPSAGITADLVVVEDDNSGVSTDPYDACDVITNAADITGKIAVIRRGECQFDDKVLAAQNEGAVAVIIVNNEPGLMDMGGDATNITIPSIMVSMTDGDAFINALTSGTTINGTLIETGPFERDGDFDNGIIAHEYGHGISSRLTGAPSQASCLQNNEQMGEGWSDFFGLVLTMQPGDQGTDSRGYGTYASGQGVDGGGIRIYPYSTDFSINSLTYGDVQVLYNLRGTHGVGTAWATMLWDLTWALIDQYGYDPDLYNGTGGNNIAMQLVIDGLKLQPCSPGFVDGRDAILAADEANNNGANKCLIWEVFAERGLGWSASQGSSSSITDQTEAFDMPPTSVLNCVSGTTDFETNIFKIYPNPTNGIVHIASTKINGEVTINLFNINGRKVMSKTVNMSGEATFDTSGLSAGIYVVQLDSEGKTQTEKLIVQ